MQDGHVAPTADFDDAAQTEPGSYYSHRETLEMAEAKTHPRLSEAAHVEAAAAKEPEVAFRVCPSNRTLTPAGAVAQIRELHVPKLLDWPQDTYAQFSPSLPLPLIHVHSRVLISNFQRSFQLPQLWSISANWTEISRLPLSESDSRTRLTRTGPNHSSNLVCRAKTGWVLVKLGSIQQSLVGK